MSGLPMSLGGNKREAGASVGEVGTRSGLDAPALGNGGFQKTLVKNWKTG